MAKWFMLGASTSIFWDPRQSNPDNQTLGAGDVRLLDETETVQEWKRGGGIVQLTEAEAQEYISKNASLKKQVKQKNAADVALEKAAEKEQKADELIKQANEKAIEAQKAIDRAAQLEKDNEALKEQLLKNSPTK